jgi:hypothetical protein
MGTTAMGTRWEQSRDGGRVIAGAGGISLSQYIPVYLSASQCECEGKCECLV